MGQESELLLTTRIFRVVRKWQRLGDGSTRPREVVLHPGAVVILPMVGADKVCLIRNFRIAVDETLWELPAGTLEAGEDPAETARRELIEETGFRAEKIEKLAEFYMSPGMLHERMHLFLATGLTDGPMALEAGEEIERQVMSWDEAMGMVDSGEIHDAKTLAGLLMYDRLRRRN